MAGLFGGYNYNKEGPGVSKNGPKKRPVALFFELYGRKFWQLVLAGLLHMAVSLPVVTKGWADAGLTFITRNYAREKHAFLKGDFFDTIRKNRGQALACGLINLAITGLLIFNILYYSFALMPEMYAAFGMDISEVKPLEPGIMDNIVMALTGLVYIVFTWMKYYIPLLLITFRLSTKQVYKNAFIFATAGLKGNLIISGVLIALYALLTCILLFVPNVMILVLAVLFWILLFPAFRSFLIQFVIFPTVKRLMIDPYYKENPGEDKQARLDLNLEVEETPSVAAGEETAPVEEEPIFSDEAPIEREETNIPRQYNDKELRRWNNRVNRQDEDDDTI